MAKKENNYYYDAFVKGLTYANEAAVMLGQCLENYDPANVQSHLDELHAIEHNADVVKHEVMKRLVREFLPPIEREDIIMLAHTIDDVTDSIEEVLRGMYMYNIRTLRPDVKAFTDLITRCCGVLIEMARELPNFRKSPAALYEKIVEINSMEEEGDRLYVKAMHDLYATRTDPIAVLAWTTMYEGLEACFDYCEDVADTVEQVVMKNS